MSTATIERLRTDPAAFSEQLIGQPMWPHQADVLRSDARYRVVCAGRQVGKSVLLAVAALWRAFTSSDATILVVSAGEIASRRLLEDCAAMANSSELLRGSVLESGKAMLTLSNGSRIISVPASQRQIRGWPVDLLIIDEAGFVDPEIWRAAEPAIIARPGSKVILSSSPWGGGEHFFRQLWTLGMNQPSAQVESWHWPSTVSPLVDRQLLEEIQAREPADYFAREYMAEWTDEAGSYFTTAELDQAVAGYEMVPPEKANPHHALAVAGIDWGVARDGNAITLLSALDDTDYADPHTPPTYYIPWQEVHYRMDYSTFINRIDTIATGYKLRTLASETNGCGMYPTQILRETLNKSAQEGRSNGYNIVVPITTDNQRKTSGFGALKVLLQTGQLILPRNPDLLRQLHSLHYEQTPSGNLRISVPERLGHDDLAMSLMQAISSIDPQARRSGYVRLRRDETGPLLATEGGARIHENPVPLDDDPMFGGVQGAVRGDGW